MKQAVIQMFEQYHVETQDDAERALREITQQVALLGMWRVKFFEQAAFYGGTALRILHRIDRFSEDLDFSLLEPNDSFRLDTYLGGLRREMEAFGFEIELSSREKNPVSAVQSAFLKTDTKIHLVEFGLSETIASRLHPGKRLKVKIEIDTDPPQGFTVESRVIDLPIRFPVLTYTLPDLFAGKMHAVLCRAWKSRVKGRDWFDLAWFVSRQTPLRLSHLEIRMRQSGQYDRERALSAEDIQVALENRIEEVNFDNAKNEARRFLERPEMLDQWSKDYFRQAAKKIVFLPEET